MSILGLDYGRKKIGLALAISMLAEPYDVIHFETIGEAITKIIGVLKKEKIEVVVVGISEGEMAKESKEFADKLREKIIIPVDLQDETLTTIMAQRLSIEAEIGRKKRKKFEDAYAATLLLQNYLDKAEI